MNRSVDFFEAQFRRQAAAREYALNPFELAVLPFLSRRVLDFGCGMGNLAVAAARKGCTVTAVDASPAAIADLQQRSSQLGLSIEARVADLRGGVVPEGYDCIVSIGLFMFFACPLARLGLERLRDAVPMHGIAAVNVLIEGTTFMDMFDPEDYCLFGEGELERTFQGWTIEYRKIDSFPAPGDTIKRFDTIVARRPLQTART